jgi:hypothetical protein
LATAFLVAPATVSAKDEDHNSSPTLSAPIAEGLAGPLQLAVDKRTVYVSQAFAGLLTKIGRNGNRTDVASNPGGEIAGVDVGSHHDLVYTSSNADENGPTAAGLYRLKKDGSTSLLRDILAWESEKNPDQVNTYGLQTNDAACLAQWPTAEAGPAQYMGIIESHPYSVAVEGRHNYVADAAANAIFDISKNGGRIRTVAVLPPQPTVITAEAATANGLPACTVGLTYNFEPVPTDVEVGRDGALYVTTLPGGPEDPSLGARGSVYKIFPSSGKTRRIATGLLGATNLALGRRGEIYVSEIFGGKVSKIVHGAPTTVLELTTPAGLEYANGKLYVTYDVFANGTLATIGNLGRHGDDDRGKSSSSNRQEVQRLLSRLHL